jgi:transforming growth factor-beta-induced protein
MNYLTIKTLNMKKLIYTVILSIWAFSFVLSQTVMEVISNSPDHTVLEQVLTTSGLNIALEGDGPFTVFAPTDDAFEAVDSATLQAILDDPDLLEAVLLYHVLGFEALSGGLSDGLEVTTLQGADVTVTINADGVFINDAQVTMADIPADNGVVHVIDAVLVPPADEPFTVFDIIEGSADHLTLTAVLETSGLDAALSNPEDTFTVFAPTDDAFEAVDSATLQAILDDPELLEAVLLYHVLGFEALSGGLSDGLEVTTLQGADVTVTINADGVFINDAQVTMADIPADNGVVHVIDAVLVPPADEPFTVFDIIEGSADHLTLTAVLETSGLDAALSNPEDTFTVFAPTDDAFEAVDSATLQAILDDPDLLEAVLLYHVLGFEALSGGLSDGLEVTTLQGANVTVTINADGVFINDAQVTMADIPADNGVVHVIDAVLVPPADEPFTVFDIIEGSADHLTLTAVLETSGLDAALSNPEDTFTVFAPTDDAFEAVDSATLQAILDDPDLLEAVLLYHVLGFEALSGGLSDGLEVTTLQGADVTVTINADGVFINDAQVTMADIPADNGVVHVIDAVLVPPADEPFTVLDIIINSPDHAILTTAVIEAGLEDDLSAPDAELTVFAPTDDAFNALPEGVWEELLDDPEGALRDILLYHVAGGIVLSTDLEDGMMITTLQGENLTVSFVNGNVFDQRCGSNYCRRNSGQRGGSRN